MAYSLYAVREFGGSLQELQKKESAIADEKLRQHVDLDVIEANIQQLKADSLEKEKSLAEAQKELNEMVLQITRSENEVRSAGERIHFFQEKQKQLRNQNENDENTIIELNESIAQLTQEKGTEEEVLKGQIGRAHV